MRGQHVRQPVRRLIEFPVGPRVLPAAKRHRLRRTLHMLGEQHRNRHRLRPRCGQRLPVADLIQPGALTSVEHIDRRQPRRRVSGHRRQHPLEPLDQCFDGGGVEHVGAELHRPADPGGLTGLGPVFGQGERQVHAGGAGVHRHLRDLQITQRQPGGGVIVLPSSARPTPPGPAGGGSEIASG